MSSRNSVKTSLRNTKYDCSGNRYGSSMRSPSMQPHVKTPTFLMFLRVDCRRIDLGPHMAVVMFEYLITSETCFISPQDMCNETIICVLLLQQPFTEDYEFLTVIWFQTMHGCVPKWVRHFGTQP
ncbi:hypothetical protein TNCT_383011 [Trichonephila clavata]|uniref:Uncharacterized protein n=1 Tax=Trichonephila clavata TaxID=2740835 RepID=A0A8X6M1Y9_TRICU|nr:hypothetical protein TNCT_383011 [Trichonephila clavata]